MSLPTTKWTNLLIIKLIRMIEKYPLIWDTKHPNYKDSHNKKLIMMQIGNDLGCNYIEVERKWQILRGTFRRQHYQVIASKLLGNKEVFQPNWFGYEHMKFMQSQYEQYEQDPTGSRQLTNFLNEYSKGGPCYGEHSELDALREYTDRLAYRLRKIPDTDTLMSVKQCINKIVCNALRGITIDEATVDLTLLPYDENSDEDQSQHSEDSHGLAAMGIGLAAMGIGLEDIGNEVVMQGDRHPIKGADPKKRLPEEALEPKIHKRLKSKEERLTAMETPTATSAPATRAAVTPPLHYQHPIDLFFTLMAFKVKTFPPSDQHLAESKVYLLISEIELKNSRTSRGTQTYQLPKFEAKGNRTTTTTTYQLPMPNSTEAPNQEKTLMIVIKNEPLG